MKPEQSKALGALLRERRQQLGYSTYQVAKAAGATNSTVVRFEQGQFAAPSPDKLARFAEMLGIPLADVYARAGYLIPDELPTFEPYLATKYKELPESALFELRQLFNALMKRHGLFTDQPITPTEEVTNDLAGEVA
jgi:transcriptional regulator with XRE-family HTH domain